jgi:hypothetical protein
MDDARAGDTADPTELAFAMVEQGIDEGMFLIAGRRVNDQAGLFVEHEEGFVLEKNFQRHLLGLGECRPGLGPMNIDLLAGTGGMRGLDDAAIDPDVTFFDQPLDGPAGDGGKFMAQEGVEPLGGERAFDHQDFVSRGHS